MALANYAYPIPDDKNPLLDFIEIKGLNVSCKFSTLRMYDELKKVCGSILLNSLLIWPREH